MCVGFHVEALDGNCTEKRKTYEITKESQVFCFKVLKDKLLQYETLLVNAMSHNTFWLN